MKRILSCAVILFCVLGVNAGHAAAAEPAEELERSLSVSLLTPYAEKTVAAYYRPYFRETPTVAPYMVEMRGAERVSDNRGFAFRVTLRVRPYFGPHLEVGEDDVTLLVSASGNTVRLEKFEHLQSFELPWNYRDEIRDQWPPETAAGLPEIPAPG